MSSYYSDSDNVYTNCHRGSGNIHAFDWHSPLSTSTTSAIPSTSSSSVTRLVVESPFDSKTFDYNIDKSQHGRLVITARQRYDLSSDYRSPNRKKRVAIQTFAIPYDADVDRLRSHVEHDTNRLVIEIPRQRYSHSRISHPSYINTNQTTHRLIRSPDIERMLTSPTGGPYLVRDDRKSSGTSDHNRRKLEYRIDCHGYKAYELEVFIQGRDLIVQGKTYKSSLPDSTQQCVSKKFSRKITLPHTVDLVKVVSYLEHGTLRIEAPIKHGVYYDDEEIIVPAPTLSLTANHSIAPLISSLENRIRSFSPYNHHYYRPNERISRHRNYDRSNNRYLANSARRIRSMESLYYPFYKTPHELDDVNEDNRKELENRHRRTANHERYSTNRKHIEQPTYKSIYSPTTDVIINATTSTIDRSRNSASNDNNHLKF